MRRPLVLVGLLAVIALLVGACGGNDKDKDKDSSAATSASAATTVATGGGSGGSGVCDKSLAGQPGYLNAFCDGTAVAKVTVDGKDATTTKGGSCSDLNGTMTFNAGVVVSDLYKGTPPDYLGFSFPDKGGDVLGAIVSEGQRHPLVAKAVVDGKTVTITGKMSNVSDSGEVPVTVVVTC